MFTIRFEDFEIMRQPAQTSSYNGAPYPIPQPTYAPPPPTAASYGQPPPAAAYSYQTTQAGYPATSYFKEPTYQTTEYITNSEYGGQNSVQGYGGGRQDDGGGRYGGQDNGYGGIQTSSQGYSPSSRPVYGTTPKPLYHSPTPSSNGYGNGDDGYVTNSGYGDKQAAAGGYDPFYPNYQPKPALR